MNISDKEKTLDHIGLEEACDKNSKGHGYLTFYEPFFAPFRDEPITLLELGVGRGHSMRVWSRYFTKAKIIGVDANKKCGEDYELGRAEFVYGNAVDRAFVNSLLDRIGPPHVVIDDASHRCEQQQASIRLIWPRMESAGIYAIEDMQTSYLKRKFRTTGTAIEFVKDLIDCMGWEDFPDDLALGNRLMRCHNVKTDDMFDGTIREMHFVKKMCLMVKR